MERIAYGMLKLDEKGFWNLTISRLLRVMEWMKREEELQSVQTRLICYFQGNHKAHGPEDLWQTESEIRARQLDIIEGRTPIATFKKLSPEEVANWALKKN